MNKSAANVQVRAVAQAEVFLHPGKISRSGMARSNDLCISNFYLLLFFFFKFLFKLQLAIIQYNE